MAMLADSIVAAIGVDTLTAAAVVPWLATANSAPVDPALAAKSDALDAVHIARDALVQTHPVMVRRRGGPPSAAGLADRSPQRRHHPRRANRLKALTVSGPRGSSGSSCAAAPSRQAR
jgi:hypothetical protein